MKTVFIFICTMSLMIACRNKTNQTTASSDSTQTFNDSLSSPRDIDSMNAIKNRLAYMTPGDNHMMLSTMQGQWDGSGTLWRTEDTAAVFSKIKAINQMGMGGRYLISTQTGIIDTSTFEGQNILGYDNAKKLFVSTWIDNYGTGITKLEGNWNQQKNQFELKGKMVDPVLGKEVDAKQNIRIIDANDHFVELFEYPKGKEQKIMEIKFTRAQPPIKNH